MTSVLVPFFEGFEEVEAMAIVDVLRRAGVNVTVAGLGAQIINSAQKVRIYTDKRFLDVTDIEFDAIVLPGGSGYNNMVNNSTFLKFVDKHARKGKLVGAICGAPMVLVKLNLLMGKRATIHPGLEKNLDMPRGDRVVVDGNIVTSQGPGTALEFSLKLVEILVSKGKADQLRQGLLV